MLGRAIFSRYAWWRQPILTLGGSPVAKQLAARLRRLRTLGLEPIGLVDRPVQANRQNGSHEQRIDRPAEGASYCGPPEQLARLIEDRGIRWAITAFPDTCSKEAVANVADLLAATALFPHVLIVNENCELPSLWSRTVDIDGCSALHSHNRLGIRAPSGWRVLKRTIDVIVAGILVLAFLPLFFVIAALILLSSPGPLFYSQERVGRGGHPFRAWKFRTMRPDADCLLADYLKAHPDLRDEWARNHKLRDDPRIIPGIGRLLRNYSLDELPQLWNVLCGDMSLVGPRPIVEEEIPKYQDDFALYVQVSPGITGLWQISGRNNTTYSRRVFLDSYYVRNWSPWLDYYILLRTLKTVLLREGAY
jgi:Undecaprenyl-phosphate galactose phosphotransferase WbaP